MNSLIRALLKQRHRSNHRVSRLVPLLITFQQILCLLLLNLKLRLRRLVLRLFSIYPGSQITHRLRREHRPTCKRRSIGGVRNIVTKAFLPVHLDFSG